MTDRHASDASAGPHGSMDDHGESHGHDDHAHSDASTALGPFDVTAWAAGLGGILLGFVVAIALGLASGSIHL
ncbi:MAG TPA: hypothetical protein VGQ85_09750 [Candidatus Limnocylindrales bacterium]|nr:hypothetical protein [Candidatus Limnocylindrales bacterium]